MPIETVCQIFYRSVDEYRKAEHLKRRTAEGWTAISSDEFRTAVEETSMGLRGLGIAKGDRVAIFSENRPEWAFADLATLCAAAADVPVYATLTPQQVAYVLKDSGAKVVCVSTPTLAAKVNEIRPQLPDLQHVVRFDPDPVPGTMSLESSGRRDARPSPSTPKPCAAAPPRCARTTSPPSSTPRAPPATRRG
jgi:long-chain acyl-CoA synthetase